MFTDYDPTLNILDITDADVAADWRNGLLRSVAGIITSAGTAEGTQYISWGAGSLTSGSLAEHFYQDSFNKSLSERITTGTGTCAVTSVTHIVEDTAERWEHDTFNDGAQYMDDMLYATVTCEHGVTGRMTYTSTIGELIYTIANN